MTENIEFYIKIASTGQTILVPKDKAILDVLWENGIEHPFDCGEGMCSTCVTTYLEGEVEHRDLLNPDEIDYNTQLTVCKSRATSDLLVLDL
tara:strand:- start:771 stop:1046 length:276 start_codon:yes stop_codon:yes gene_type:complete